MLAGVSPVLFYDPIGRVVATLHPNDTWEKAVFDPWHRESWDVNDTVLLDPHSDPDVGAYMRPYLKGLGGWRSWYEQRVSGDLGGIEQVAAGKTAAHASTPTRVWLDTLGRPFLAVAHNRGGESDELLSTRAYLDIEGNEREVVDAKGRSVMRYGYDLLGSRIAQSSMEAGARLVINDVTGQPIFSWNSRGFHFRTEYDALRRLTRSFVHGDGEFGRELLHERTEYGEERPGDVALNLRGRVFRQYDAAGVVTNDTYDFKGNPIAVSRQLAEEYKTALDWAGPVLLEQRIFTSQTRYDALNRPIAQTSPDSSVIRPTYNEANLLKRLEANLRGADESTVFVADIAYNARGQRSLCIYGNGVHTAYDYDPLTLRLSSLRTLRGTERLQNLSYTYDPIGNITHIRDDAQQTLFFRNRRVEPSADYTYDAIYRLIEATGREHLGQAASGGYAPMPTSQADAPKVGLPHPGDGNAMGRYVQRYVYDEVGNFLKMIHRGTDPTNPGWTRTYSYAEPSLLEPSQASDRLTSTSDGADATFPSFTYDAHGNTTFMRELPLMRWDYHDQLQATSRQTVKNGGSPETTYFLYDATGQRVRKVTERQAQPGMTASRKSERIYFGGFEVFRRYGARGVTALERETLHIMGGEQRVALVEIRTAGKDDGPEQLQRYQLTTHLGSTTLELDALAGIISYEEYYPYGCTSYQAVARQTDTPKRYRYTGMERDEETGLSYHSARYYSPWMGRWISPDPNGIGDGTNLYGYVSENPIALTDGSGLQEERQTWLAEIIEFVINPKATRRGSGVSKLQRLALKGIDIAFGPGTGPRGRGSGLDWGHPKPQPHGTTLATQDPPLRPEPYGPNRSSYQDKLTKQRAAAAGQPVRNAEAVDTTAKIGARQTQPAPKPFEQPMADYWESSKQWTPPTQTPRAAPTASPASGPSNQLDLPFDRPAPPGGGTGPPSGGGGGGGGGESTALTLANAADDVLVAESRLARFAAGALQVAKFAGEAGMVISAAVTLYKVGDRLSEGDYKGAAYEAAIGAADLITFGLASPVAAKGIEIYNEAPWEDPVVQKYMNDAVDSFTGMDEFKSKWNDIGRPSARPETGRPR